MSTHDGPLALASYAFYPPYITARPCSRMEAPVAQIPTSQLRLSDLNNKRPTNFTLEPTAPERKAIAQALGISDVRKLRFVGNIAPSGGRDWRLQATLGATVVQSCVISLEPVTTRIDEEITRLYSADLPEIDAPEIEMPEDETVDPLPASLDIAHVMIEALSLALPAYPRADGARLETTVFSEPGVKAMSDDDAKPFAGLSALKESLEKKDK